MMGSHLGVDGRRGNTAKGSRGACEVRRGGADRRGAEGICQGFGPHRRRRHAVKGFEGM